MLQVAVFVDAGYLFAQGSTLLAGQKQSRSSTFLDVQQVVEALIGFSEECVPDARLLRVYWYDGAVQGRLSSNQEQLAASNLCKLRLGLVNSAGEQKGVDSLIVTDMIELARNHAISDAVLVAGDEDLRIGVQIAQGFGVQVHLVGIKPARGSQSNELIREADTHHEWQRDRIETFLNVSETTPEVAVAGEERGDQSMMPAMASVSSEFDDVFEEAIQECFVGLGEAMQKQVIAAYSANSGSVPQELDRKMLPTAGAKIGRQLTEAEKRKIRRLAKSFLEDQTNDQ